MSRFFRTAFFGLRFRRDGNSRGARRARKNEKADVRGVHIMADVRFFIFRFSVKYSLKRLRSGIFPVNGNIFTDRMFFLPKQYVLRSVSHTDRYRQIKRCLKKIG